VLLHIAALLWLLVSLRLFQRFALYSAASTSSLPSELLLLILA
jgi:hypothetical protein